MAVVSSLSTWPLSQRSPSSRPQRRLVAGHEDLVGGLLLAPLGRRDDPAQPGLGDVDPQRDRRGTRSGATPAAGPRPGPRSRRRRRRPRAPSRRPGSRGRLPGRVVMHRRRLLSPQAAVASVRLTARLPHSEIELVDILLRERERLAEQDVVALRSRSCPSRPASIAVSPGLSVPSVRALRRRRPSGSPGPSCSRGRRSR